MCASRRCARTNGLAVAAPAGEIENSDGPMSLLIPARAFCNLSAARSVEGDRLHRRLQLAFADALVLRDHLGAEEDRGRAELEAEQHDDRGRERAVDDAHLRERREV